MIDPETGELDNVNLATLAEGAAVEMVNEALVEAFRDIRDPNTPATAKREIKLVLTLAPDEERQIVKMDIGVEKKLAKVRPSTAMIELSRQRDGQILAVELSARPSRQREIPGVAEEEIPNATPISAARARKE